MMGFRCFSRTWWCENPSWPNGLEPEAGRKRYRRGARFETEEEARNYCIDWNDCHDGGRYSLKMEFEEY